MENNGMMMKNNKKIIPNDSNGINKKKCCYLWKKNSFTDVNEKKFSESSEPYNKSKHSDMHIYSNRKTRQIKKCFSCLQS